MHVIHIPATKENKTMSSTSKEFYEKREAQKKADGWKDRSCTKETYTGVYMKLEKRGG
jgi:hypothetical protein